MLKKIFFVLSFSLLSISSFANDGIDLFRDDVKPLVQQYLKKQDDKILVDLLNKEFNTSFLKVGKYGLVASDLSFEFDDKNKNKLQKIYNFFVNEFKSKNIEVPVSIEYLDYEYL